MSEFLPTFTTLTSFSAAYTNITNYQVSLIGRYMSLLVSLDLSYCHRVSDAGVRSLVAPVAHVTSPPHHDDNDGHRFGQCKRLSRLLLSGSQLVTSDCVETVLLNLDHLSVIDFHDTAGVIYKLLSEGRLNKTLKLRSLYVGDTWHTWLTDTLPPVLSTCPAVSHVYIVLGAEMKYTRLLSLLDVEYLEELHVRVDSNDDDQQVETFSDVMTPVLTRHGETLVSINISEASQVSVSSLCQHCPRLTHLALLWNKSYRVDECSGGREWFPALKTLNIAVRDDIDGDNCSPVELSYHNWFQLLCSSQLKSVAVTQSRNLSDECLQNVATVNSFHHLEQLELTWCHEVSFDSLELLLEADNPLTSVKLIHCDNVTKRDVQKYQKKVEKWKWNVNLEWC